MADPIDGASPSASPTPRCPWCSAELSDPAAATCPSCKANLVAGPEPQVPGLTALDLERLAFRRSTTPKKSRLLSWISGDSDYEDATKPVDSPGSLARPNADVRREMLRIETAALIADLAAEAGALATDDALALGDADPTAAAAAIQAQLDVAAMAQSEDAKTDAVAKGASTDDGAPTGVSTVDDGSSTVAVGDEMAAPDETAPSPAPARSKSRLRLRR